MKKMFLAAAMMLASVATFAQNAEGQITIQPKVGLNIANITDDDDETLVLVWLRVQNLNMA